MKCLTVNYNTPELIDKMLTTFRKFYDLPLLLVDGSSEKKFEELMRVVDRFEDIEVHHFDFNIHHGRGLAYGFNQIDTERVMVIDSDIVFYRGEVIERMNTELSNDKWGIGDISIVNEKGFNVKHGIKYLHPAFMLVNKDVYEQFPSPVNHGAPMISTMKAIHESGRDLLVHAPYIYDDFAKRKRFYIEHEWKGTVSRTGGYHLSGMI